MRKKYKITKHNSTVCGYPGRDFDWSKFCWDGSEIYKDKCGHFKCKHDHRLQAPLPLIDNSLIGAGCQYLHVPYDWAEHCTIYRVRPNESLWAGKIYRGYLIETVKALKKADGWYWLIKAHKLIKL